MIKLHLSTSPSVLFKFVSPRFGLVINFFQRSDFESPSRFNHFDNEVFSQLLASSVVQLLFLANKCERNRFWQAGNANHSASTEEGVDVNKIDKFIGDIKANTENHVFRGEQEAQVGKGSRGDVTILPTIVINNKQPRGERSKDVLLERSMVLKDLCSGFSETTEPHICLNKGPLYPSYTYLYLINTNFNVWFCDCAGRHRNQRVFAKQWRVLGSTLQLAGCATFRGRVCQCPVVQRVKFWVKVKNNAQILELEMVEKEKKEFISRLLQGFGGMLQLKQSLHVFFRCGIGNGRTASFWYDYLTELGHIGDLLGPAGSTTSHTVECNFFSSNTSWKLLLSSRTFS
ncbi:hypothetical protein IGI04_025068 [Brassica rapa subsp. trilocularis]|uniref:Vacuolar sorting receptor thioredoxin-like domain-containing protein n=1 Tax=Brassica rapa subsp. trilocularis TaxID=1813537 RepID=A0ABQ7M9V7_BRACM|nr:hypothetical protein IGI04_025068 [Brassica rapa subsp. trilocularis]